MYTLVTAIKHIAKTPMPNWSAIYDLEDECSFYSQRLLEYLSNIAQVLLPLVLAFY
jgi:hypothetical protein